jgi:hypothetical protein
MTIFVVWFMAGLVSLMLQLNGMRPNLGVGFSIILRGADANGIFIVVFLVQAS